LQETLPRCGDADRCLLKGSFCAGLVRGTLFTFSLAGTSSPLIFCNHGIRGALPIQIFELEGLICKIFRAKELAALVIIFKLIVQLHN